MLYIIYMCSYVSGCYGGLAMTCRVARPPVDVYCSII